MSLLSEVESPPPTLGPTVQMIINYTAQNDLPTPVVQKLDFLAEQLSLLARPTNQRRYLKATFYLSVMLQSHSSACYQALLDHNVLTIPTQATLRRILHPFRCESESEALTYLKNKRALLNTHESMVTLVFDEIHVYQTLNYSSGKFIGRKLYIILAF